MVINDVKSLPEAITNESNILDDTAKVGRLEFTTDT